MKFLFKTVILCKEIFPKEERRAGLRHQMKGPKNLQDEGTAKLIKLIKLHYISQLST